MRTKDVIKLEEGFSGSAYPCPAGYQTIGYGRNLESNPLSKIEAEYLLDNDLSSIDADLFSLFGAIYGTMGTNRRNAVISMRYQLGSAGFRRFKKMIAAIMAQNWPAAARHALDSRAATQTPKRYERIAEALEHDRDPWAAMR